LLVRAELRRGARHRDGAVPDGSGARARLGASRLVVVAFGLLVVRLLPYRVTIDDHAAARDSHRRDDRGDQSAKAA
jgi:hypothetical protein